MKDPEQFGSLLKKFRLSAGLMTLTDLGKALAEQSFYIEDSALSRWQSGNRIPERETLLLLIKVLKDHNGLKTVEEANNLLETGGKGYLTKAETDLIGLKTKPKNIPFQVPHSTNLFVGRKKEIETIKRILKEETAPIIAICGSGGVGKTTLTSKIASETKSLFPDGILWSRLDVTNLNSIIEKIAFTFDTDLSGVHDTESRIELIRSILAHKKALLIFDNVENSTQIKPLLPAKTHSAIMITSRNTELSIFSDAHLLTLQPFSPQESQSLFTLKLGNQWLRKNISNAEKIGKLLGNLPLALTIILSKIAHHPQDCELIINTLSNEKERLTMITNDETNARLTYKWSFDTLTKDLQQLFSAAAIFDGADFSLEALCAINNNSENTKKGLEALISKSLIELSIHKRYRLHPLIKLFAKENLEQEKHFTQKLITFYTQFLSENKNNLPAILDEIDNIIPLTTWCIEQEKTKLLLPLWSQLSNYLYTNGYWKELKTITTYLYQHQTDIDSLNLAYCLLALSRIATWEGDLTKANIFANEGYRLSKTLNNTQLQAEEISNLGYIAYHNNDLAKAEAYLQEALSLYQRNGNKNETAKILLHLADISNKHVYH